MRQPKISSAGAKNETRRLSHDKKISFAADLWVELQDTPAVD
jgi:hypothetical protein